MQITSNNLGKIYQVSGQRIRLLQSKGCPVEDPDAFLQWLKDNKKTVGRLYWFLLDDLKREDLSRQIDNLIYINDRAKSQPI